MNPLSSGNSASINWAAKFWPLVDLLWPTFRSTLLGTCYLATALLLSNKLLSGPSLPSQVYAKKLARPIYERSRLEVLIQEKPSFGIALFETMLSTSTSRNSGSQTTCSKMTVTIGSPCQILTACRFVAATFKTHVVRTTCLCWLSMRVMFKIEALVWVSFWRAL